MNAPSTPRFRQPIEPLNVPPPVAIPQITKGKTGTWIILDRTSPFFAIFPGGEVPTTQYLPTRCVFEGDACQLGWKTDWERVTAEQRAQILTLIATKTGDSLERVAQDIAHSGLGIRITAAVLARDYDNGRSLMA